MKRRLPLIGETLKPGDLVLPPEAAHYVNDVLRLGPGEELELFDGDGGAAAARITGLCRDDVQVTIDEVWQVEPARPQIRLYQCIPKGDRWELVIEKATELGVNQIIPVTSRRTVVEVPERKRDRKLERWNRIGVAASRQCGRYHAPRVEEPRTFAQSVRGDQSDLRLVGDPLAARQDLREALAADPGTIGVWIGPEGGLTHQEVEALIENGARRMHLAESTLRSETAGIFAVGLLRFLAGGNA